MACDVFDGFEQMTQHLNPELYSRLKLQDYWLELVDRSTYAPNTGLEQTVTTLANTEPESAIPDWSGINTDFTTGAACQITYDEIKSGFDTRTYEPEQKGYQGTIFCKDQFTFDWMTDEFINHYLMQLTEVTRRVWSNRFQQHFISLSTKVIANGTRTTYAGVTLAPTDAQATLPAVQATSELTQDMLDNEAYTLIYKGALATQPDAKGYIQMGPEGPIFPLLIGLEMSKRLSLQSGAPQYPAILSAGTAQLNGSELMKNIGATKILFNFRHIPCMYPARYNWNGSGYVFVEPFIQTDATGGGVSSDVNPDWLNAKYEAAEILHPLVMRTEIVEPQVNAGGLPFDPTNYFGEWQFIQGGYRLGLTNCPDPLNKFGAHFAEFKHAIRPIFPDYGRTFIFKRCLDTPYTVGCS